MKVIILFIVSTLFLFQNVAANNLELRVQIDKENFLKGEPIWVKVTMQNIGIQNEEVTVLGRSILNLALHFEITDSKNNKYFFKGATASMPYLPTAILKPKEIIYEYYDLLESYGELLVPPFRGVRHYLENDIYTLSAELSMSGDKIYSNKISFSVKEPVKEELTAYELFKEGFITWLAKKEDLQAIDIFRRLVNNYPNSVYAELSFNYLRACFDIGIHDYLKAIDAGEELIRKYPKSHFSGEMITSFPILYRRLGKIDKTKEKLMELSKEYGDVNPEIKKNAKKIIDSLEK